MGGGGAEEVCPVATERVCADWQDGEREPVGTKADLWRAFSDQCAHTWKRIRTPWSSQGHRGLGSVNRVAVTRLALPATNPVGGLVHERPGARVRAR